jgi:cysteinyl-tRNA synthetase
VLGLDLHGGRSVRFGWPSDRPERTAAEALEELGSLVPADCPGHAEREERLLSLVQELLVHREAARRAQAWDTADAIRQGLAACHFRVEDTRTETHAVREIGLDRGRASLTVTLVKG